MLEKLIKELSKTKENTKEFVLDVVKTPIDRFSRAFSRENIVNSIMPKFMARGVNSLFDYLSTKNKETEVEKNKIIRDLDRKTNINDDGKEEKNIEKQDDLLLSLEKKIDKTNELLNQINENTKDLNILKKTNNLDEKETKILENLEKVEKSDSRTLKRIEKILSYNELQNKEDEFERRLKRNNLLSERNDNNSRNAEQKEDKKSLLENALNFFGLKSILSRRKRETSKLPPSVLRRTGSILRGMRLPLISLGGLASFGAIKDKIPNVLSHSRDLFTNIKDSVTKIKRRVFPTFNSSKEIINQGKDKITSFFRGIVDSTKEKIPQAIASTGKLVDSVKESASNIFNSTREKIPSVFKNKPKQILTSSKSNFLNNITFVNSPKNALSSFLNGAKNLGGKLLGTPLLFLSSGLEAKEVSDNKELTKEEKVVSYSKIGGKLAGALAGAKAGAVLGATLGPVGSLVGGVLGGIGGTFLGDEVGEKAGNLINSILPQEKTKDATPFIKNPDITKDSLEIKSSDVSNIEKEQKENDKIVEKIYNDLIKEHIERTGSYPSENQLKNYKIMALFESKNDVTNKFNYGKQFSSEILKPVIRENLLANETKLNNLKTISKQMEISEAEKQQMVLNPVVVVNNQTNNSNNYNQDEYKFRIPVPSVRNQENTIQKLLDSSFLPLVVT